MADHIYNNINTDETLHMDKYTKRNHTPQHTGCYSGMIRSYRAAVVCLLLLCVLLLTAVIVLCVYIHTKNTNYSEERDQLLTNLTEERDQLTNLTEERDQLLTNYTSMMNERNELIIKNEDLTKQKDQFNQERSQLQMILKETEAWFHSNFGFYFISSLKKSWTESRRYCTERGADLVVIKSKEKQDFVTKMTDKREFWIGVTDIEEEGRWKWVDGTSVISGFWASREPNGGRPENCAVTSLKGHPELIGWLDVDCSGAYQSICEKSIWP